MNAANSWRLDTAKTTGIMAYERLRRAIIDGEFAPGERLTELAVAERLGVSRTPVREAFARLARDGLVQSTRGWGIAVVDPRQELSDIYHVREAMEGRAARLAAARGTVEEIARIEALAQASLDADPSDVETRARLNAEFHLAITQAAHAPRIERLIEEYRELFASPRGLRRYSADETRRIIADHQAIARAIRARDSDAAEAAMQAHLRRAYAVLLEAPDAVAQKNVVSINEGQ